MRLVLAVATFAGLVLGPASAHAEVDLLVFTKTSGYRHDSIPVAIAAVEQIAVDRGWTTMATEDAALFEPEFLAQFEGIVFLSTTGELLDDVQSAALQGWVQQGGGFVGIHSVSNSEEDWPWFVGLVGTTFASHPAVQAATVHVVDPDHPATIGLPDPWMRTDEWYNFTTNPSATVQVLLRLDETTYEGGTMGRDHPIAWVHEYDGRRSFYTAGGHTIENWSEPEFLAHVAGGIEWAVSDDAVGGSSDGGDGSSDGSDDGTSGTTAAPADSSGGEGTTTSSGPDPTQTGASDDDSSDASPADDAAQSGCGCTSARATGLPLVLLAIARRRRRFHATSDLVA